MTEILAQDAVREGQTSGDSAPRVVDDPAWPLLKEAVEELRVLQQADGSVDLAADGAPAPEAVRALVERVIAACRGARPAPAARRRVPPRPRRGPPPLGR